MNGKNERIEEQQKALLKETFDAVAVGYDGEALRFFPASGVQMAALLAPDGAERLLDVACGTGNAALAIAAKCPGGHVTAVDFSPGMLAQARLRAEAAGLVNIEFVEGDMQRLNCLGENFDAALCAFGIFFAPDMAEQLARIVSVVKPGGRVMTSTFHEGYFQPLRDLFLARLSAYGVKRPSQTWQRVASESGCRELFAQAGLSEIRVVRKNLGYYLRTPEEWWSVVWNAGFRRLVNAIDPAERERFRQEHLTEVNTLATQQGIWLDIGVLYTIGTKAP